MWIGTSRTSYARFKDLAVLAAVLAPYEVIVSPSSDLDDAACLLSQMEDGGWPRFTEDDQELDLPSIVAEHLRAGEVIVFQSVGADKLRYVSGYSEAITHDGRRITVDLDDIVARAKSELNAQPGQMSY